MLKIVLVDWHRDWQKTAQQPITPTVLDLSQKKMLTLFLVSLGNGIFEEICVESDATDTIECVRGAFIGTGGAKRLDPDQDARQSRLYREGYEMYVQTPGSYFFLNPVPRPELFAPGGLAAYASEFG